MFSDKYGRFAEMREKDNSKNGMAEPQLDLRRVLVPYTGKSLDELTVKKDSLFVVENEEGNWVRGRMALTLNKRGKIPLQCLSAPLSGVRSEQEAYILNQMLSKAHNESTFQTSVEDSNYVYEDNAPNNQDGIYDENDFFSDDSFTDTEEEDVPQQTFEKIPVKINSLGNINKIGKITQDYSDSFTATHWRVGEYVSIKKDNLETDEYYWVAKRQRPYEEAYIPCSYIGNLAELHQQPWYVGKIDRRACDSLLLQNGVENLTFLVRDSVAVRDGYVICVRKTKEDIKYKRINLSDDGFYIINSNVFPSLVELIDFHSTSSNIKLGIPYNKYFMNKTKSNIVLHPLKNSSNNFQVFETKSTQEHIANNFESPVEYEFSKPSSNISLNEMMSLQFNSFEATSKVPKSVKVTETIEEGSIFKKFPELFSKFKFNLENGKCEQCDIALGEHRMRLNCILEAYSQLEIELMIKNENSEKHITKKKSLIPPPIPTNNPRIINPSRVMNKNSFINLSNKGSVHNKMASDFKVNDRINNAPKSDFPNSSTIESCTSTILFSAPDKSSTSNTSMSSQNLLTAPRFERNQSSNNFAPPSQFDLSKLDSPCSPSVNSGSTSHFSVLNQRSKCTTVSNVDKGSISHFPVLNQEFKSTTTPNVNAGSTSQFQELLQGFQSTTASKVNTGETSHFSGLNQEPKNTANLSSNNNSVTLYTQEINTTSNPQKRSSLITTALPSNVQQIFGFKNRNSCNSSNSSETPNSNSSVLVKSTTLHSHSTSNGKENKEIKSKSKGKSYSQKMNSFLKIGTNSGGSSAPKIESKKTEDIESTRKEKKMLKEKINNEWRVDPKDFTWLKMIGSGHYGEVWKGKWKGFNGHVALKKFKSETMTTSAFHNEAESMMRLKHPNLIKLFGISIENKQIFLVMEFHNYGSILDYLKKGFILDEKLLEEIGTQVASGMDYLGERKFIHRDLSARNVLLDSNLVAKVADFGLIRDIKDLNTLMNDMKMPWKWTAPEAYRDPPLWSTGSDVWSYGVFLWEIYTNGAHPYKDITNKNDLLVYLKRGNRLSKPVKCSNKIYLNIMLKCWEEKLEMRLTFKRIKTSLSS